MSAARNKSSMAKLRRHYLLAAAVVGCALGSIPAAAQTSFASGTNRHSHCREHLGLPHPGFRAESKPGPDHVERSLLPVDRRHRPGRFAGVHAGRLARGPVIELRSRRSVRAERNRRRLRDACSGRRGADERILRLRPDADAGWHRLQRRGIPERQLPGAPADVLGLQALAAAPNYRSNCFVATLADAVTDWHLDLIQSGTETVLGSTSGSLGPFQTTGSSTSSPRSACQVISRTCARLSRRPTFRNLRSSAFARSRRRRTAAPTSVLRSR